MVKVLVNQVLIRCISGAYQVHVSSEHQVALHVSNTYNIRCMFPVHIRCTFLVHIYKVRCIFKKVRHRLKRIVKEECQSHYIYFKYYKLITVKDCQCFMRLWESFIWPCSNRHI